MHDPVADIVQQTLAPLGIGNVLEIKRPQLLVDCRIFAGVDVPPQILRNVLIGLGALDNFSQLIFRDIQSFEHTLAKARNVIFAGVSSGKACA